MTVAPPSICQAVQFRANFNNWSLFFNRRVHSSSSVLAVSRNCRLAGMRSGLPRTVEHRKNIIVWSQGVTQRSRVRCIVPQRPAPLRGCGAAVNAGPSTIADVSSATQSQEVPFIVRNEGDRGGSRGANPSLLAAGQLCGDSTSFVEQHRIRAYEVGPDQCATIVTVANLLQEVAGNNGVALWGRTEEGFATDPIMVANNLIFVATRIQIQMDSYPKWGDLVEIETWFQPEGRIGAQRNWTIKNVETGESYGRSTSTWVMLNTVTRRPVRIPEEMRAKLVAFCPKPPRLTFEPEDMKLRLPEFPQHAEIEGPKQVARRSDIDMNGHINNVTYLAWTQETIPLDTFLNYKLHQVEIDYKAECNAGDTIESLGFPLAGMSSNGSSHLQHFLHTLQRSDGGGAVCELVRCRTSWTPRPGLQ